MQVCSATAQPSPPARRRALTLVPIGLTLIVALAGCTVEVKDSRPVASEPASDEVSSSDGEQEAVESLFAAASAKLMPGTSLAARQRKAEEVCDGIERLGSPQDYLAEEFLDAQSDPATDGKASLRLEPFIKVAIADKCPWFGP